MSNIEIQHSEINMKQQTLEVFVNPQSQSSFEKGIKTFKK